MPLQSLANRQSLWLLAATSLVAVGVGAVVFPLTDQALRRNVEAWNAASVQRGAASMGERLESVATSARLLRALAADPSLTPRQEREIGRDVLLANPMLAGIALLRPSGLPRKASPFWFRQPRGPGYRDLSGDLGSYKDALWFRKGVVCMQGCWGDTFHSDGRRTELLHYSLPLTTADGTPDGMVSADVALGWLHQRLQVLSQGSTVAFVFDRQAGRIVAHPDNAHQGKILKDIVDLDDTGAGSAGLAFRSVDPATSDAWSVLRGTAVRYYLAPVPGSSWTLALSVPQDAVMSDVRRIQWLGAALILLGMSVLAIFVRMYLRRSLRPLQLLDDATRKVAAGNLDFHLPPPRTPHEIGRLTQSFSQMQGQLREYLGIVEAETAARQRANAELDIAQQIQASMLPGPDVLAGTHAVDAAGYLLPEKGVGGDFYTYATMGDDQLYFMLGDVSGNGIPASLFMARTITLARMVARRAESPSAALAAINRELLVNNDACMFVTAVCGTLDLASGVLRLAGAGHDPGILRGAGIPPRWLQLENGPPLGLDDDARFPEKTLQLTPGQALLFYTDGITEARDCEGRLFGSDALLAAMADAPAPASQLVRHVLATVGRHQGETPHADDVTLLVVRWLPPEFAADLSIPNTLAGVGQALGWIERHADALALGRDGIQDVRLVAEELLVNVVEHGYPHGRQGRMQLSLLRRRRWVTLRIDDDADPFDPTRPASEPSRDDDERARGGVGLYLTQHLTSALRYHRSRAGNHVEADFPLPSATKEFPDGTGS